MERQRKRGLPFVSSLPQMGEPARAEPGCNQEPSTQSGISHMSGWNSSTCVIICCLQGSISAGSWNWKLDCDSYMRWALGVPTGILTTMLNVTLNLQFHLIFQEFLILGLVFNFPFLLWHYFKSYPCHILFSLHIDPSDNCHFVLWHSLLSHKTQSVIWVRKLSCRYLSCIKQLNNWNKNYYYFLRVYLFIGKVDL